MSTEPTISDIDVKNPALKPGEFLCRECGGLCSVYPVRETKPYEQYCTSCSVERACRFAGRGRYEK